MGRLRHSGWLAAALLVACGGMDGEPAGARLTVEVAALSLAGVGDVVWDVEVANHDGDVVWQRRVTSSAYGDGAGSASLVGPCDAAAGANPNTVSVWVVGVYADVVSAPGPFASGDATAIADTPLAFAGPTATAPLTRSVTCSPNADVAVTFDVTLARPAEQGFFDVAVSFDDLFCAAKLDCCYDRDQNGCSADETIALLFDADGARGRTFVLGLACTAGLDDDVVTDLYLDPITLDCSAPNSGTDFSPDLTLDPDAVTPGNQCTAGEVALCGAVDAASGVDPDTYLYQVAVFRGSEMATTGGANAGKVYWNLALGVTDAIAGCRLRARATADDAADPDDGVVGGVIAAGRVYPVIAWDVALGASCGSEALGVSADVTVAYTSATTFTYQYAPSLPGGPPCVAGSHVFAATGAAQSFTMPTGCATLEATLWGAGGGAGRPSPNYDNTYTAGGAGGFTAATLSVPPGTTLTVVVGVGGVRVTSPSIAGSYGGGGGTRSSIGGGFGGGRSALRLPCGDVATAGGGGGGSSSRQYSATPGGAGGGDSGETPGGTATQNGGGGTQTQGGAASIYSGATAGAAYQGGIGAYPDLAHGSSGGGGGWFGGGASNIGGGGGGSGYVGGCGGVTATGTTTAGSGTTPPATADPDYMGGVGVGGDPTGGPGRVVLRWSP